MHFTQTKPKNAFSCKLVHFFNFIKHDHLQTVFSLYLIFIFFFLNSFLIYIIKTVLIFKTSLKKRSVNREMIIFYDFCFQTHTNKSTSFKKGEREQICDAHFSFMLHSIEEAFMIGPLLERKTNNKKTQS